MTPILSTLLALLGAATPATAQEPVAQTPAPPFRSVAFRGREGGLCDDRHLAQHARCLDVVDLLDLDRAWTGAGRTGQPPTTYERAILRHLGILHEHALEDLATRWTAGDIAQTLVADGYVQLPAPAAAWERSRLERRAYALPAQSSYLGLLDWYDPTANPTSPRTPVIYPHVKYLGPDEQSTLAPTVVIAGRFARRLGHDGKAHDYDLMDADPSASAPFFEELFPYRSAAGAPELSPVYETDRRLPLVAFRFPTLVDLDEGSPDDLPLRLEARNQTFIEGVAGTLAWTDSWDAVHAKAAAEFERFSHIVYTQTAQFAMEDVTANHARVLAAMTAMAAPPGSLGDETGLARELVAAARGETDTAKLIEASFADALAQTDAPITHLQYYRLPTAVIEPWMAEFDWRGTAAPATALRHVSEGDRNAYHAQLNRVLAQVFADNLRTDSGFTWVDLEVHEVPDPAGRRLWMQRTLQAGMDRDEADLRILREALQVWLDQGFGPARENRRERQQEDTRLLLAQARLQIALSLDETAVRSPAEVSESALQQWVAVLDAHGYTPRLVEQGLGAVDPLSVCTTLDGQEALGEPVFRQIHVDQLVPVDLARVCPRDRPLLDPLGTWTPTKGDGPRPEGCEDGPARSAEDLDPAELAREIERIVLWQARGELPFLFVDDPGASQVEVTHLVDLGTGERLYRVRWSLWTGWHLFWDAVPHEAGQARLVLRTGAVCDDMVLAPPNLVPTVIRAGLLTGNLRPSVPETRKDLKPYKDRTDPFDDPEASFEGAQGAAGNLQAGAASASQGLEALKASPADAMTGLKPGTIAEYKIPEEPLDPHTQYFRDLVHETLEQMDGAAGLLVLAADASPPGAWRWLRDGTPRTPYTRVQGRIRNGERHYNRRDADAPGRRRSGDARCFERHGEGLVDAVPEKGRYKCYKEPWRPRGERHVTTAGWLWYFQPSREEPVQVSPAYEPKDSVSAEAKIPRWSRRNTVDYWLAGAVGGFPYRAIDFTCADTGDPLLSCEPGLLFTDGFGGDLQGFGTWTFHDQPRLALEFGLEARVDVVPGGTPRVADDVAVWLGTADRATDTASAFTWLVRPAAGVLVGFRFAGRPTPLHRHSANGATWIAPRPDGSSKLRRWQAGLRGGALLGPGFNGIETTLASELWAGGAIRRKRSAHATFTPYHPATLLGPYARLQYGFAPGADAETEATTPIVLQDSFTIMFGVRTQFRLKKATAAPDVAAPSLGGS